VEVWLAIFAVLSFLAAWTLSFWLREAMPQRPEADFVVPMIIHGRTIYVTWSLNALFHVPFWGSFAMFAGAVLIDFYKDPFNRRSRWK